MYILMYTEEVTKTYSVAAARSHLPDILDDVEAGKEIQLTRRGRAVAVVLSTERYDALRKKHADFRDGYRTFLSRYSLEEIGLEEDFFESGRDREPGRRVRL
jgi:prevent-host-death family protein